MQFKEWLHHNAYRMFQPYETDEVTKYILEIFNTNLEVKQIKYLFDFSTEWFIDGEKFHFIARKFDNNEWSVGFDKKSDMGFKKGDFNRFVGDVFTGVFESLRMLVQKHNVDSITFSTEKKNHWLLKFYDSKPFQHYLEKHFRFSLVEYSVRGDSKVWLYKKNWNEKWMK